MPLTLTTVFALFAVVLLAGLVAGYVAGRGGLISDAKSEIREAMFESFGELTLGEQAQVKLTGDGKVTFERMDVEGGKEETGEGSTQQT